MISSNEKSPSVAERLSAGQNKMFKITDKPIKAVESRYYSRYMERFTVTISVALQIHQSESKCKFVDGSLIAY